MNSLIIDTTRKIFKAVLVVDGKRFVGVPGKGITLRHTAVMLPVIDGLLKDNRIELKRLDALACVVGPGSFTGIRVGATLLNAFSFSLNLPLISLTALEIDLYGLENGSSYIPQEGKDGYCLSRKNGDDTYFTAPGCTGIRVSDIELIEIEKCIQTVEKKYNKKQFVKELKPFYMKLSSAENNIK